MKLGFLRTRVARRIVLLFFLCALLPVGGLAVVSYLHVRGQLQEQSQERLQQVVKAAGMAVVERLLFVEEQLRLLSGRMEAPEGNAEPPGPGETVQGRLRGVAELGLTRLEGGGDAPPGLAEVLRSLDRQASAHLSEGGTLLLTVPGGANGVRVFLVRPVNGDAPDGDLLWARADPSHLWGAAQVYADLPTGAGMCVVDEVGEPLFCPVSGVDAFLARLGAALEENPNSGAFRWTPPEGEELRASYWAVFLEGSFQSDPWKIVAMESVRAATAPIQGFQTAFVLIILGSLCVVVLLSNVQIRRNLDPLAVLKEGTVRIAEGDFNSRVEVESGDEFEELAGSFNEMARNLGSQFNALSTISEIDRAVLSALETETIVDTILGRIDDLFPCHRVALCLLDSPSAAGDGVPREGLVYTLEVGEPAGKRVTHAVSLERDQLDRLAGVSEHAVLKPGSSVPGYLVPVTGARLSRESAVLLPMVVGGEAVGFLALFAEGRAEVDPEDVSRVRQITDQVAVALSNAHLIQDLDDLTLGSLTALARTIDAKSPWTAGHSERVRNYALGLARELGMSEEELDLIHRGALLHDIGKLGIPPEILDKPGRLTEDEMEVMRSHVTVGARILEPVAAFRPMLPLVLHHHESFDGSGYPDGLSGEEIPLMVRIMTVADVFDAVTSERPYRSAMSPERAREFLKEKSGIMFDPELVQAFNAVIERQEAPSTVGIGAAE